MLGIEQKVQRAARKGAAFSAAGVLAIVGVAFLTAAGWMVLSELRSPVFAATVIGLIYIGAAAIAVAIGLKKPDNFSATASGKRQPASDLSPLQLVVLSFVQGFEQGRENNKTV
ncbi:MAG: phage holin family protein [Sulfitobacter sp.]